MRTILDTVRARVVAIREEAGGNDAEALARLFEDPDLSDDGSAAARLRTILDATERTVIRGLHTSLPFLDHGFRGDRERGGEGLRDPWEPSRNQVGHFLTAVGLAFRPEKVGEPVLGPAMRAWLGAAPGLSDEQVGKRLTVGHELRPDPGVLAGILIGGLSGLVCGRALSPRGQRTAAASAGALLGGLAGALAQQFLGFRRQYRRATDADEHAFDGALIALGRGPELDMSAAESALAPILRKIDINGRGNSHQDLRLSLLGWWLGEAIRRGRLAHGAEVAAWVRRHLKA